MSKRDFAAEVRRENEAVRVLATEFRHDATDVVLALLDARDAYDIATQRAEAAEAECNALLSVIERVRPSIHLDAALAVQPTTSTGDLK